MRSIVETAEGTVDGYEREGRVQLLPKTWHLLSLSHNSSIGAGVVSFSVDGKVDIERSFNQDENTINQESHSHCQAQQWYFATGLCGRVSS